MRDLQESFYWDFRGRTRETLQKLLEADSQQRMAEYLGLQWRERAAEEAGRIDARELPKEEFKRQVSKHLTGKETEPWEIL